MDFKLEDARKIICTGHGFPTLKKGQQGTQDIFQKIPCVQVDSIDVIGKNHDLTLLNRVEDYKVEFLDKLLYDKRVLFEYYCKMLSILPIDYFPIFKNRMDKYEKKFESYFERYKNEIEYIFNILKNKPVSSLELKDMGKEKGSWRYTNISNKLMNRLWLSGKLMIHHQDNGRKYYCLTDSVLSKKGYTKKKLSEYELKKQITKLLLKSSRIVSPSKASEQWSSVGKVKEVREILEELEKEDVAFSLKVSGWKGRLYTPIEDKDMWENRSFSSRSYIRFLAPLDPLLWNRALFAHIFGKEYVWEVYKKREDRKYGYYCLPIIFNSEYVGLIEPYFRKDDEILEIKSFYLFDDIDDNEFLYELRKEIDRCMNYLGAKGLEINTKNFPLEDVGSY